MNATVTIFHNVVWSRHKGAVLSALHNISGSGSIKYSMVQIADTEHDRIGFSDVDYSFHSYPMRKLFNGCYEDVPTWRMTARLTWEVLKAKTDGSAVRLKDVARVELGRDSYASFSRLNGKPAATVGIRLSPQGNAMETSDAIRTKLAELSRSLPPGVAVEIPFDSSKFVHVALHEVALTLFEAVLLVFLVMWLFLQNLRATLIPTVAVPVVLLGTVEALDLNRSVARTDIGEIPFDYLIIGCGATHSYFGHDQWEEFAPGLKTLEQATEIRRRVLTAFELAERISDPEQQSSLLTFAIVGGGPTGVELAGAIAEMSRFTLARDFRNISARSARVVLLEAGPRILPTFSDDQAARAVRDLGEMGRKKAPPTRVQIRETSSHQGPHR